MVGVSAAVPGIRFACGTLLGSPAKVVPPDVGAAAASAARQPSSPADAQLGRSAPAPVLSLPFRQSIDGRPRRNQSDSTASKIGSLFSSLSDTAGGTITSSAVDPNCVL